MLNTFMLNQIVLNGAISSGDAVSVAVTPSIGLRIFGEVKTMRLFGDSKTLKAHGNVKTTTIQGKVK